MAIDLKNIMQRATPANVEQVVREFQRIKEKVEKFTGERGDDNKSLSAIRRGELTVLASNSLQSSQITGAPTQAQYNALQADVKLIFDILSRISNSNGTADIPKV